MLLYLAVKPDTAAQKGTDMNNTNSEVILELKNINKKFPGVVALEDVNLQLYAGEIHCLVGENGSGKSTLVKILSGVFQDYEGEIFINSEKVNIKWPKDSRANKIGAVQQGRDLVPTLNSIDNIFLGNEHKKNNFIIDSQKCYEDIKRLLEVFNLNIDLYAPVEKLTVAEQQIIAIIKALMTNCRILLIDEGTAPLGEEERGVLFDLMRNLKKDGIGIIFISHDIEEIICIGDRVSVLRDGKIVATKNMGETDISEIVDLMMGGLEKKDFYRTIAKKKKEEFFSVKNLNIKNLLYDINLNISYGEIVGITGLAGSNKELIAEALFGLVPGVKVKVKIHDKEIFIKSPIDAIKNDIGLIPSDRRENGLVVSLGAAGNICLSSFNKNRKIFISNKKITNFAKKYIDLLSIKVNSPNQRSEFLSGGNQQKVVISKWLATECKLLLCVEPTEGIDVKGRLEIYEIFNNIAREGRSIVVISSDIDEVMKLSNRIVVMKNGRIFKIYLKGEITKDELFKTIISKKIS